VTPAVTPADMMTLRRQAQPFTVTPVQVTEGMMLCCFVGFVYDDHASTWAHIGESIFFLPWLLFFFINHINLHGNSEIKQAAVCKSVRDGTICQRFTKNLGGNKCCEYL
jgi:hypothetical protein